MIIDGKKLAAEHESLLKKKIQELRIKPKVISIRVGDMGGSEIYSEMKTRKATDLGIKFEIHYRPPHTEFSDILREIEHLNKQGNVDGLMIQLPLPPEFLGEHKVEELLHTIDPEKDVDGLTGKGLLPATVKGVISILESIKIDFKNNIFAVVGSKGQVGSEMVKALKDEGGRVIEVDQKDATTGLGDIKNADVVISCTGVKGLVKPEHVKVGVVAIDIGLGDFDSGVYEKASAYTPIKGGVGPMTVISLMENVVEVYGSRLRSNNNI